MQFLNRDLLDKAKSLVDKFPFLAISEPRQSGKTKLAKMLKPEYQYVNLELPPERNYAQNDPLVGIRNEDDLKIHFARGAVFENLILTEIIKNELNQGLKPNVYYWRDNHQNEVDIIQEKNGKLIAYEIKSSETYHSDFLKGLKYFKKLAPDTELKLIYAGDLHQEREGIQIRNWKNLE